jgi:hypothetical protein
MDPTRNVMQVMQLTIEIPLPIPRNPFPDHPKW